MNVIGAGYSSWVVATGEQRLVEKEGAGGGE